MVRYIPIIARGFEEKPIFMPLRLAARDEGEEVRFTTADGLELTGTYLSARAGNRSCVLVFCHEFLSNRWSYHPYADALRDLGFDIFTFDFRNHGTSASDRRHQPLQWVSRPRDGLEPPRGSIGPLRASITTMTRPDSSSWGSAGAVGPPWPWRRVSPMSGG